MAPLSFWKHTRIIRLLVSLGLFFSCILQICCQEREKSQPSVAICSAISNGHLDIKEWIRYHEYIGVEKFYIFDHGSARPMFSTLEQYIVSGKVQYYYFNDEWKLDMPFLKKTIGFDQGPEPQAWALTTCVKLFGHRHDFIAIIDVDEFIFLYEPGMERNLPGFMKRYEDLGGLVLHWKVFGSSGHLLRPFSGVLTNYVKCMNATFADTRRGNKRGYTKSITNTKMAIPRVCNPHLCGGTGTVYLNENMEKDETSLTYNKIALHHYQIKSWQDFQQKISTTFSFGNKLTNQYWHAIDDNANENCTQAVEIGKVCCGHQVS